MPAMDITKPEVIVFLIENYEKETRLRLNWLNKNREKVQQAAILHRNPTNYFDTDVERYKMKEGLAALSKGHHESYRNRRKVAIRDGKMMLSIKSLRHGNSLVDIGMGDPQDDPRLARPETDLSLDPIMRPVDPEVTEIVHKPLPEFGREVYLKKRRRIPPEKKYYLSPSINCDYGWRLGDSKAVPGLRRGRFCALTRARKTRVGPQPDPSHYNTCGDIDGPSTCGL